MCPILMLPSPTACCLSLGAIFKGNFRALNMFRHKDNIFSRVLHFNKKFKDAIQGKHMLFVNTSRRPAKGGETIRRFYHESATDVSLINLYHYAIQFHHRHIIILYAYEFHKYAPRKMFWKAMRSLLLVHLCMYKYMYFKSSHLTKSLGQIKRPPPF